ncbi:coagulation factor VII [Chanos chanos]|uniref:Coagulation factor VII n=1 Tax=Chanos chanos TaxID=29144 RepID=A0A6J2VU32_CHACN|nr:coagulation factor VII-like [Chanos chanos]
MESRPHTVKLRHLLTLFLSISTSLGLHPVFLSRPDATRVLLHRARRANSFLEELKVGDLERECLEETCSYEEAKEIFSVPEQLDRFWKTYSEVDQCESSPCQNGATCMDQRDAYICMCPVNFEGRNCEKARQKSLDCLYKNGGCEHFCVETSMSTHCECAPGYSLSQDNSSCIPQVAFPCGRLVPTTQSVGPRIVRGDICPKGQCPWQALLEYGGLYKCGAIVVNDRWMLTAAHCVWQMHTSQLQITVGEHIRGVGENTEQVRKVAEVFIHPLYNHQTTDNDIALLKLEQPVTLGPFVVPVCLPPTAGTFGRTLAAIRMSTVSGWGRLAQSGVSSTVLQKLEVPRVPLAECRAHSGLKVTRNMLCAGFKEGGRDSCQGDSGGPLTTRYRNTSFLTGVVSWGKGCARSGLYGVYTRVSVFVEWINSTMATG